MKIVANLGSYQRHQNIKKRTNIIVKILKTTKPSEILKALVYIKKYIKHNGPGFHKGLEKSKRYGSKLYSTESAPSNLYSLSI